MRNKYDILIVGCGLTSSVVSALLKDKYNILIVENKKYIGGACADKKVGDGYVSLYGPHIFHTNSDDVFSFVSKFSKWNNFKHICKAEYEEQGLYKEVFFPFWEGTIKEMGREFSREEILNMFFKGYSEKMWGIPFEMVDKDVIDRIPIDYSRKSYSYFKNSKYELLPEEGYSSFIENMIRGCDIELGVSSDFWKDIKADVIIYTGRIDRLVETEILPFRTINFDFKIENNHRKDIACKNICHKKKIFTRKVYYDFLYKSSHGIVSYEIPTQASFDDINPLYPVNNKKNNLLYEEVKNKVIEKYPNLIVAGRMGLYKYMNMDECVEEAIKIAQSLR